MIYIDGHRAAEIDDEVPENGEYESLRSVLWDLFAAFWFFILDFLDSPAGFAVLFVLSAILIAGMITAPQWWPV